jgi:hypothetical protein
MEHVSMPLDHPGAPAPRPLSTWIDHLKRRRLASKKGREAERQRCTASRHKLAQADRLIAEIIASADLIGQGIDPDGYPAAYLLLTLHRSAFEGLATFGAELEDLEDSNDAEPEVDDEPSVGADTPEFDPCDLGEPRAYPAAANAAILAETKARYNPVFRATSRFGQRIFRALDPETKRAGAWLIEKRRAAR